MVTTEHPTDDCFFISPIGDEESPERKNSDLVKEHILTPALVPEHAAKVVRADGDANPGEVTPAIVRSILDAKLVVADITGANPNVYYELAIAHAFSKAVIHIARPGELPRFDIKDSRIIRYGTVVDEAAKACKAIAEAAGYALAHPESAENPVSRTANLKALEQSGNPAAIQIEYLARQMEQFDARLSRALRDRADEPSQRPDPWQHSEEREDLMQWANRLQGFIVVALNNVKTGEKNPDVEALLGSAFNVVAEIRNGLAHSVITRSVLAASRADLGKVQMNLMNALPSEGIPGPERL